MGSRNGAGSAADSEGSREMERALEWTEGSRNGAGSGADSEGSRNGAGSGVDCEGSRNGAGSEAVSVGREAKNRQAGRERENCLHSQHNTHTTKDNGSAQDYIHQEAK